MFYVKQKAVAWGKCLSVTSPTISRAARGLKSCDCVRVPIYLAPQSLALFFAVCEIWSVNTAVDGVVFVAYYSIAEVMWNVSILNLVAVRCISLAQFNCTPNWRSVAIGCIFNAAFFCLIYCASFGDCQIVVFFIHHLDCLAAPVLHNEVGFCILEILVSFHFRVFLCVSISFCLIAQKYINFLYYANYFS